MPAPNGGFPSVDELRRVFRVDEHSRLLRKFGNKGWVLTAKIHKGSNYFKVVFKNKPYAAHRIIWAMHHGRAPVGLIDHINGKPWDNRIENLREASYAENRWNSPGPSGKSAPRRIRPAGNGWQAIVSANHVPHVSPIFEDEELAELAASEMARKLHGAYAFEGRQAA